MIRSRIVTKIGHLTHNQVVAGSSPARPGKNLFGEGGAFAPLLKNVIEKALEAEMEVYSPQQRLLQPLLIMIMI